MTDWPTSWDDDPWPLDDPVPAPTLRPANWSDTHTQPPQVADLADEAWQRAFDRGISMERALAELQSERHMSDQLDRGALWHTGGMVPVKVARTVPVTQQLLDDAEEWRQAFDRAWDRMNAALTADPSPLMAKVQEMADRAKGDRALNDVKRAPLVPSWQWDQAKEDQA